MCCAVLCCAQLLSCVRLFATIWTVAHQAPLSMGILQAEIVEWLPWPPPWDLPNPDVEPESLALQADSLPAKPPGKPSMSASIEKLGDWDGHIYSTICKIDNSGGGHGNPLQYSCLENPHGQRSLVCYGTWGRKELDTTKWPSTLT